MLCDIQGTISNNIEGILTSLILTFMILVIVLYTDYGRPMKPFFIEIQNPELFGLDRQIEQINSGAFGVFLAELSAPILVQ